MFESFFPKPKLFFVSLLVWVFAVVSFYYLFGQSLAGYLGFDLGDDNKTVIGLKYFITPDFLWFDVYYVVSTFIFFKIIIYLQKKLMHK